MNKNLNTSDELLWSDRECLRIGDTAPKQIESYPVNNENFMQFSSSCVYFLSENDSFNSSSTLSDDLSGESITRDDCIDGKLKIRENLKNKKLKTNFYLLQQKIQFVKFLSKDTNH